MKPFVNKGFVVCVKPFIAITGWFGLGIIRRDCDWTGVFERDS